jgi:alanine racemase
MATGRLSVDLSAVADNWRALQSLARVEAAAVVKADAYGLGLAPVARALAQAGARKFLVAFAEEGHLLRRALGPGPEIMVLNGHMEGDARLLAEASLVPLVNSVDQLTRQLESLPGQPFGLQLDTGMNRLGLEWAEWAEVAEIALSQSPVLVMSHLACADEADHPMNPYQLDLFRQMTDGIGVSRSLAATGGILLGPDYAFDLVRPGIGLYGGLPFDRAQPVVSLDLPVIQIRELSEGEVAGYGNTWQAQRPSRLATVAAGYADGVFRALSHRLTLWDGDRPVPAVGRVSMDLIIADVTDCPGNPDTLSLLGPHQTVDALAEAAGTIGYEVLTALGPRYARAYPA